MNGIRWASLVMRWIMEAGIVFGLAFWGVRTGSSTAMKIVLAVGAPMVVFGFWGYVDFRSLGKSAEAVRLVQELAIAALVTAALIVAGQPILGWVLAGMSVVHHLLLYLGGDRLIKERT